MDWLSLTLAFVGACAWGGMVFERSNRYDARWPLVYAPWVVGWLIGLFFLIILEIIIRIVTLGGYGARDFFEL